MTDMTFPQAIVTVGLALIAAIPPTLVAWAALQQSKRNAAEQLKNTAITESTAVTVDKVHADTNGSLSEVKAELADSRKDSKSLRALVAQLVDASGNGKEAKGLVSASEADASDSKPR